MLTCPKCRETKDETMFFKNKNRASGYNSYCKECLKQSITMMKTKYKETFTPISELECRRCKLIKTIDNFHRHAKEPSGYYPICSQCQKETYKTPEKVAKHWESYDTRVLQPKIQKNILKVLNILGFECADCKREATVDNFTIFDVHHAKPELKTMNITVRTLRNDWNMSIENELTNCVLLCACCHRLRHKKIR